MKTKILIGFLNKDNKGPIPTITQAFIDGLSDRFKFVPFKMDRRNNYNRSKLTLINFLYFLRHYFSWILNIIRIKPNIVHFPVTSFWNMEKSLLFLATAKLLGVKKTIGHLHGGAFKSFWTSLNPFRKKVALAQFKNLDAFIVLSPYWKDFVIRYIKINPDKVFIVNNPIDISFERYFKTHLKEYHSKKDTIIFLCLSNLTYNKGILDIIKAFQTISKNYYFFIVGDEIQKGFRKRLERAIINQNLKENIYLLGPKYDMEKIKIMEYADVFILPSYVENFPLVVIEAACAGLPIIATPIGALPDFFSHLKNIYFVEPGNIAEIRRAIKYMMLYPDERKRLGHEAKKVFQKKLAREKIMTQLCKVYCSI